MAYFQKYRDRDFPPSFYWDGSAQIKIRLDTVVSPREGQTNRNDWVIAEALLLPDPDNVLPMRQRMEFTVKVAGAIPGAKPGMTVEGAGKWEYSTYNPRYPEWQLLVSGATMSEPITEEDIKEYLLEIKHLGPARVRSLLALWGLDTLAKLDEVSKVLPANPTDIDGSLTPETIEALSTVPAEMLGALRKAKLGGEHLVAAAQDHAIKRAEFSLGRLLARANIHGTLRRSVLAEYRGRDMKTAVLENPTLVLDIEGMDFTKADALWQLCGITPTDIRRVAAGVYYTLKEYSEWGHCYMGATQAITKASETLRLPDLPTLWFDRDDPYERRPEVEENIVVDAYGNLWQRRLCQAEIELVEHIKRIMAHPGRVPAHVLNNIPQLLAEIVGDSDFIPGEDQARALLGLLRHRFALLIGSAGTGKTTIVKLLLKLLQRCGIYTTVIMAPTGAAARRATRATGSEAATIHSEIKMRGGDRCEHDDANPMEGQAFIIDEMSMVDIVLGRNAIRAIPTGAYVFIVGDSKQLPAVGPGAVLRDFIDSGVVPVFELKEVRRNTGALLRLAYSVLNDEAFAVTDPHGNPLFPDVEFVPVNRGKDTPEHVVAARIIAEVVKRYVAIGDPNLVKALVPTKGKKTFHPVTNENGYWNAGVNHQNEAIADALLGPVGALEPVYKSMGTLFRVGHRCLWLSNTRDPIFPMVNGQDFDILGITNVLADKEDTGGIFLRIGTLNNRGEPVEYSFRAKDYDGKFMLGFARTIHKSQGDGYPIVIVTIRPGERLSKEMIYTALTRAEKKVIIIGVPEKIWGTVAENYRRKTGLTARLIKALPAFEDRIAA